MKFNVYVLLVALATGCNILFATKSFHYRSEFKFFIKKIHHRNVFNKDIPRPLRDIQRDIENYKELSLVQRLLRSSFLNLNVLVITPTTMPSLYAYVESICTEHGIRVPTIFITTGKGFFNAAATKLLMSSGAIVLGQKLILELSDEELEAVIAHEIGHIKYNHINKMVLTILFSHILAELGIRSLIKHKYIDLPYSWSQTIKMGIVQLFIADLIQALIINKRFERQADEFAYKEVHTGCGLIQFFEHLKEKEWIKESAFDKTYDLLQNNASHLSKLDYSYLMLRYYLAKFGNDIDNVYKWMYYNTPFGMHPSPDERIAAVQEYFDSKE